MILFLRFENFRSIGKKQEISFIPGTDNSHMESILKKSEYDALSVIPVYGGNATGKTNSLKFIKVLKDIISSHVSLEDAYDPCKFYKESPSGIEIVFVKNNIKYYYMLKYTAEAVLAEGLYAYPHLRIKKVFERKNNEISLSASIRFLGKYLNDIPKERTLLTFVHNLLRGNDKDFDDVYDFFVNDLIFLGFDSDTVLFNESLEMFKKRDSKAEKFFLESFYNHMNIGAKEIRYAPMAGFKDSEEFDKLLNGLNSSEKNLSAEDIEKISFKDGLNHIVAQALLRSLSLNRVNLVYEVDGKEILIDIKEESKGVQKLFSLGTFFARALAEDKILIYDELETGFHPFLAKKVIELFHSRETGAQLIFTTHNTNLLDLKLFRRDQIYFVERTKKTDYQTNIKSLSEIPGIRKTTDIEKAYLEGAYCDAPYYNFPSDDMLKEVSCQ